jgi:hypothetical protein
LTVLIVGYLKDSDLGAKLREVKEEEEEKKKEKKKKRQLSEKPPTQEGVCAQQAQLAGFARECGTQTVGISWGRRKRFSQTTFGDQKLSSFIQPCTFQPFIYPP